MKEILKKLIRLEDVQAVKSISEEFVDYYNKHKGRHSYAEVSTFYYSCKEEDVAYLIENLEILEKYFDDNSLSDYSIKISKLLDHLNLETYRDAHIRKEYDKNLSSTITMSIKNLVGEFATNTEKKYARLAEDSEEKYSVLENNMKQMHDDAIENYNEVNNNLNIEKDKIANLNSSMISILGIFSAVVVAFFGGISVLGSALNNMQNVTKYRLGFVVIISGIILFDVIFMLLYSIAKLSDKSMKSELCKDVCDNCRSNNSLFNYMCLRIKYPIAFWFNVIALIFIGVLSIALGVDKYNIFARLGDIYNLSFDSVLKWISITILITITILAVRWINKRYIKKININQILNVFMKKNSENL